MKMFIVVFLLMVLVAVCLTHPPGRGHGWGHGRPGGHGWGHGGPRGHGWGHRSSGGHGRGWGRGYMGGWGRHGRGGCMGGKGVQDWDCHRARMACRIELNNTVLMTSECSSGTCNSYFGTAKGTDGQTYTFYRCSDRPGRGRCCLSEPYVLPSGDNSPILQLFCDDPEWYEIACNVTVTATGEIKKQQECPHSGQCTSFPPGSYVYQGQPVTVSFCTQCDCLRPAGTVTAQEWRDWRRRCSSRVG